MPYLFSSHKKHDVFKRATTISWALRWLREGFKWFCQNNGESAREYKLNGNWKQITRQCYVKFRQEMGKRRYITSIARFMKTNFQHFLNYEQTNHNTWIKRCNNILFSQKISMISRFHCPSLYKLHVVPPFIHLFPPFRMLCLCIRAELIPLKLLFVHNIPPTGQFK